MLLAVVLFRLAFRGCGANLTQKKRTALCLCLVAILVLILGFALSVYPTVVPFRISYSEASSASASQGFIVVGAAIVIPVILGYTILSYRIFKGKVESWSA